ncbi:glycosyltransferase [Methylovulum sp.]|uniref:glycosyltransferase n=1 Tax=Methylovulum sp. TaxID=1916980 RepID=UPI0026339B1B|nr:glycosyltransferase [Methylovulum sp.]MDD5124451.1 glycosyltransferase [Methylovulum sp.]
MLAKALEKDYEIELLGTAFGTGTNWGKGLWLPLESENLEIKQVPGDYFPGYFASMAKLISQITGDVVIACKPRLPSYGIALVNRLIKKTPIILDVDDDEIAQTLPGKKVKFHNFIRHPNGYWATRLMNVFRHSADATFCVSSYFQSRYGGVIVPHGREVNGLKPGMYKREDVVNDLGIDPSKKTIGFIGTPQAAKGVHKVLEAINKLNRKDVLFVIVGGDISEPYLSGLLAEYPNTLMVIGPQPLAKIAYYYAAIDIIVLPQENVSVSLGQMPAKLTDAMAMAKPIIASRIADIPHYIQDCGLLIEPGSVDELADAIQWLLNHPDEATSMGLKARKAFEEKMTTDVMLATMKKEINRCLSVSNYPNN